MSIRARLSIVLLFASGLHAAAPVITSIQNPASNILPGLPNFGIAQGQIFVLYGTDMGPATLTQASALPLPTTLPAANGTQIKITQNGTVYNAPILYVLNTQIAAVMPSNVPVSAGGATATVQVTYNGLTGNSFATTVVDSNFGISTVDQSGGGAAVITDPVYSVITRSSSAIPGKTYTMWGTGLGATDSDNNLPTKGTFPHVHVFVGGIEASVPYAGISAGVGLNQINFTIPAGLSGCAVSLIVQSDTTPARVSNATTIPIAANGGECADPNSPTTALIDTALAKGTLAVGALSLDPDGQKVNAFFLKFLPAQGRAAVSTLDYLSPGSCTTYVQTGSGGDQSGNPINSGPVLLQSTGLNAGTSVLLTPPSGAPITLAPLLPGVYTGNLSAVNSGTYVYSGTGGADVGPFSVSFAGPSSFAWTNSSIKTVVRSQGLSINWTGGDANSFVDISGYSNGNPVTVNGQAVPSNVYTQFECVAPASAGSFQVPANILLALPQVSGSSPNGSVFVYSQSGARTLTIPGTDYSFAAWTTPTLVANVAFQ